MSTERTKVDFTEGTDYRGYFPISTENEWSIIPYDELEAWVYEARNGGSLIVEPSGTVGYCEVRYLSPQQYSTR